ncbi:hypothetical protein ACFLY4_03970 [Chloroflexota bacterium]
MYPDLPQPTSPQPTLLLFDETLESVELLPEVWSALEDFTKPDVTLRANALDRLINLDAPRYSPVVTYIIVTRIADQNLELRARIIETLGNVLVQDNNGSQTPIEVRTSLHLHLSGFRTRQIYAMLQVCAEYPTLNNHVVQLLNSCPYAGNHLIDIVKDNKTPLEVRKQAASMIGKVGYLYTIPALERLAARLETRLNGQKAMSFATHGNSSDAELLPWIKDALGSLRAP